MIKTYYQEAAEVNQSINETKSVSNKKQSIYANEVRKGNNSISYHPILRHRANPEYLSEQSNTQIS